MFNKHKIMKYFHTQLQREIIFIRYVRWRS